MRRLAPALVAATLLAGLLVLTGDPAAAAGTLTVDPTLVTRDGSITVTGTGCVPDDDADRWIAASLVTGSGAATRLAGIVEVYDGEPPSKMRVPAWVDLADPLVVEADCIRFGFDDDVPTVDFSYATQAITLLPDAGVLPAQDRTFSRTAAAGGQAIVVSATGCTLTPGPQTGLVGGVALYAGDDLSRPPAAGYTAFSDVPADVAADGSFSARLDLLDLGTGDGGALAPGTYVAVPYCGNDDETLVYEPQLIEVSGGLPTDRSDLTVDQATGAVTLAGQGCTEGTVQVSLVGFAIDPNQFQQRTDRADRTARAARASLSGIRRHVAAARPGGARARRLARAESLGAPAQPDPEPQFFDQTVATAADGSWSVTWDPGFSDGVVFGGAVCGDPTATGFLYDQRFVEVLGAGVAPPTTVPVTTPPPPAPPAAAPANAVPGTPTFAG